MDLKEANEFLEISKEEKKAVQRYIGFANTRINLLASLDPYAFRNLNENGWVLAKSEEELKQDIEDFVKIYSAMYKESRNIGTKTLYRGTSDNSAKKLYSGGTYNRIISTSENENIAKTFSRYRYGNSAMVRIKVEGEIPVIYANDYIEKDVKDENEIILAPFSKVKKAEYSSNWNGCIYYNIILSAPELEEISQERIEELKQEIFSGYTEFVRGANNLSDNGERAILDDEHKSLFSFASKLRELMQGLCKQKELEIDRAKQVIKGNINIGNKENISNIKEEPKKTEVYTESQNSDIEEQKQDISNKKEEVVEDLELQKLKNMSILGIQEGSDLNNSVVKEYEALKKKEEAYVEVAQKLGIYFEKRIQHLDLELDIVNVAKNIGKAQNDLEHLTKVEEIKQKSTVQNIQDIKSINDGIMLGKQFATDLPSIRQAYVKQAMDDIKKSLYVKVQTLIRDEKKNNLYAKKDEIENSKSTILEKFFGKGKLKNEQLRSIDLQIESLTEQPIKPKSEYSVKDCLAEMKVFSLLNNKTQEMENLETSIYQIFGGFTREEVEELAIIKNRQRAELPAIVKDKVGLFGIRKEAKELRWQNDRLETEIHDSIVNANNPNGIQNIEARPDAVAMFKNKLQAIGNVVKDRKAVHLAREEFEQGRRETAKLW